MASLPTNKIYYRPYISDSESDSAYDSDSSDMSDVSGTGTESTVSRPVGDQPDYRQFASNLQLLKAGGPNFPSDQEKLKYEDLVIAGPYPPADISGVSIPKTTSSRTTATSIIMLDSRNRDISVYPQPTFLQLRLPRVYKNVTNFQVIQIKLLSSFFYFRRDKNNLSITIHENGRYLPNGKSNIKNSITSQIREGTYNIATLINELNLQLNRTPIFYDYINGFIDFAPIFASTGDYSLNFNQPGDNYFDALNNQFIINPTMTQIVQKYFQTLTAGLTSYTLNQLEVAYYYPVLKEALLDSLFENDVNLTITTSLGFLLPEETVRSRCIYTFQGINDPVVHEVIKNNVPLLNSYRLKHTFRNSLINRYVVSVATNNNRITITSPSLNTSLVTLLNNKNNQYLAEQLNKYNLTLSNYNALSTSNAAILAILTDEYYFIERMFAIYFGINFNTYSLPYYANFNNQLPLQNALQNQGISSNYDVTVIEKNISPQTNNELSSFRTQAPAYWPRLINLPQSTACFSTFVNLNSNSAPSSIGEFSHPYNLLIQSEEYVRPFIDASGTIYQNPLYKSANIITDINPTEYTVFKFRSNTRQTLRVTALPRPTQFRYPAYNAIAYDASQARVFDNSYAFIQNAQNANMDVLTAASNIITIPGFNSNSSNFGIQFASAYALWTSNVSLDILNSRQFFTFYTPRVPSLSPSTPATYVMNVTVSHIPNTSNFYSPINVYLYQDRAAFMADISDVRNEKPLHYKQFISTDIPTANLSLQITAYSKQQYYLMVRTKLSTFNTMQFRVVPSFTFLSTFTELSTSLSNFDPFADPLLNLTNFNYAQVADSNFIKLPIGEGLWSQQKGVDSNFATFTNKFVPMGYDSNGVSTDLTDYVGYVGNTFSNTVLNSITRIDPITGYIFQVGSGYNSNTSNYVPGNGNILLTSNGLTVYNPTIPKNREFVIAHWYSQIFIPNSLNQPYVFYDRDVSVVFDTDSNGNTTNVYSLPYVRSLPTATPYQLVSGTPLQGYNFNNDGVLLSLGDGMVGISIIPDDGIWDIQRVMLRSAYITTNSNFDTNRQIKYLGIYNASYINSLEGLGIQLSNALTVLELSTVRTYTSTNTNFGFDRVGGTYYEWVKSSNFIPASNQYLNGFAQTPDTMIVDSNAFYTALPFTAHSTLTTFSLISGSLVPYPYYSDASASAVYLDGTSTPTGQYVVVPKVKANPGLGPPPGFDQSQSKYEQSIPIGTSVLQYLEPPTLAFDISGVKPFGPNFFKDISGAPLFNNACFRVPGYVLFEIGGTYSVYTYTNNTEDRNFYPYLNFTPGELFVNLSNSQVVGVSGNNTEFAFLGVGTTENPPGNFTYVFQIETYSLETQTVTLRDTITNANGLYPIPAGYEIFDIASFNYNDFGGWTFTFRFGLWDTITSSYINVGQVGMAKGTTITDTSTPLYYIDSNTFVGGLTPSYEIYQTPNERFGNFYVIGKTGFVSPPSSSNTYFTPCNFTYTEREFIGSWDVSQITSSYAKNGIFYVNTLSNFTDSFELQTALLTNGSPFVYNSSNSNIAPFVTRLAIQPNSGPLGAAFANITLVQNPIQNKIFLSYNQYDMSNNLTETYYEVTTYLPSEYLFKSNAYYTPAAQVITSQNGIPIAPYQMLGGGGGSLWFLFNENNRIDSNNPSSNLGLRYDSVWGNRGDSLDFPKKVKNAYQIFYPTQRIVMTKIAPSYNPITDLSGLSYPEFPHTCLFAYDTINKLLADISGNKWGLESSNNFMVADTNFSGNYFNAATLNVPLLSNHEYYLTIRGYTPTEKSQVMLRFSLPNRYDAGYARIIDISNEIILAQQQPKLFNSNYANTLLQFNSNFIIDSNGRAFGSNLVSGFSGIILSNVAGFGDFMNRFVFLYNIYTSNAQLLSTINTAVASNLSNFIRTDLAFIIPPSALNRQRYTDPLTYSILFRSALEPLYLKAEDNWGLGWNLGYAKQDTPYDTTQVAESFYKILDDYINLRLSPEYDLNRMDTGAKENLQLSQETTGSIKAFHAKLLLANFGSYAQTLISNPLTFQIPIPKMDKLTFEWQDINSQTINNNDCEWNMVLQVVEEFETVKAEKVKTNVVN